MDNTRQVFGIDLGTTYSCVAQVDEFDRPVVQKNFNGQNTTPSVVYFETDSKVIVGEEAKEMLKAEPERTVAFIKRFISTDEAYEKPTKFPAGTDPTQISAYILKKIVKDANDASQSPNPVTKVVITCPAYFGTKERLRTKQAGEIAGLEVLGVINEPTAAAIAYGMKLEDNKTVLVYDLGGGTFDVTVIRVSDKTISVVATDGNHHLGGYDWDKALAQYLLNQFNKEHKTEYTMENNIALANLLLLVAEEKKKTLTGRERVNIVIDYEGKSMRSSISRQMFELLTKAQLDETIQKTREVLEIAKGKNVSQIDEVLLVGGSSRMPQIKARVDRELKCDAKLTDPDECVAKGAAIFALNEYFSKAMEDYAEGRIDEKPKNIIQKSQVRVINVTSKNYGTDFMDDNGKDMIKQLIFANTPLNNCRGEDHFVTRYDNQSYVSMKVYESDVTEKTTIDPSEAVLLVGDKSLQLSKNWPKGTPIKVVFEVDSEGILNVHAKVDVDVLEFELKLKGVKTPEEMGSAIARAARTLIE
ncbi:MAG: Hsp70 family protein [Marinilabiliaceae bacterium]|nr:Hsp70 family protein [Marinilabiliaceae bacterium]